MLKKEKFQLSMHSNINGDTAFHAEVELIYVLEGSVNVQIEQKTSFLKADDIIVINSNKKHSFRNADNPLVMRLLFDYMMICDKFQGQDVLFWCNSSGSENERYDELRVLLKNTLKHYVESENYSQTFSFQADCYRILDSLTANFMVKAVVLQGTEDGDRYEERLSQINNYINLNYDQPISMKELSEKLFLSNGYLSRFFKKNYGMSFANYLTNVRILHAVDELMYTDVPVTRVAYDCGFTSAALFNKVFKKTHGITPTEFRKRANSRDKQQRERDESKALEKRVEQNLLKNLESDHISEKTADSTKIIENNYMVTESREVPIICDDTINFGHASNLLHSATREHLMILKSALDFTYVRFWSIFSKEFYIRPDQEHYDFSQIDSVLDFVQEQGMKPFIDLGLKPNTIHFEIGITVKYEEERFTLEQWERLMRAFMRHLNTRYGQHMLSEWRFELWFDESLRHDRKAWQDYFERFRITWQTVKEYNESILVGGYGIRMDSGGDLRQEFLTLWGRETCLPDFISVMYYAYERGEDGQDLYARRSTDNDNFIHFLSREKRRLAASGFGNVPVYVCEWNLTPSVRNFMNDSVFKGAYVVKNVIDVFGEVASMGYGAGSDRMYASYDTTDMLFGGTGLITKEAILKPAAFAYDFLKRLFPYMIGKTGNYLITTDRHNNYSIVCHNQQVLNYNYYLTAETAIDKENLWKYFEDRKNLKLHIHLMGMKEGWYRLKLYRISENHGSVLDIWREMEYDNELSKNDIKYFRRICEPYLTIRKVHTNRGHLLLDEILAPNEICLIRMRYAGEDE